MVTTSSASDIYQQLSTEQKVKFRAAFQKVLQDAGPDNYSKVLNKISASLGPTTTMQLLAPEGAVAKATVPKFQKQATPAAESTPWYAKPVKWAEKQPVIGQALKGMDWWNKNVAEPSAMTLAHGFQEAMPGEQGIEKSMRQWREQHGVKFDPMTWNAWKIPADERRKMWEKSMPWAARLPLEIVADPSTYIGFGLPGLAKGAGIKGLTKLGMEAATAEKLMVPLAAAQKGEEALTYATNLPLKGIAKGMKVTPGVRKLFQEAPEDIVKNTGPHTFDAMANLFHAGDVVGMQPEDVVKGLMDNTLDPKIMDTLASPAQKRALSTTRDAIKASGYDIDSVSSLIKGTDKYPMKLAGIVAEANETYVGRKMGAIVEKAGEITKVKPVFGRYPSPATKLGAVLDKATGTKVYKVSNSIYNLWRRAVLMTPNYAIQNAFENPFRQIAQGRNPLVGFHKVPKEILDQAPLEIRRKAIPFKEMLAGKESSMYGIPASVLAESTKGMTEAAIGSMARGYAQFPLVFAAKMDNTFLVGMYADSFQKISGKMLKEQLPELDRALTDQFMKVAAEHPDIDPDMVQHLMDASKTGNTKDVEEAFSRYFKDKTTIPSTPKKGTPETELPQIVHDEISKKLPSLINRGDSAGISKLFSRCKQLIPEQMEAMEKQFLRARLKHIDEIRAGLPDDVKKLSEEFRAKDNLASMADKEERVLEGMGMRDAKFKLSRASRRELEQLVEQNVLLEFSAGGKTAEELAKWYGMKAELTGKIVSEADIFLEDTRKLSNTLHYSKDRGRIKEAWDVFIANQPDSPGKMLLVGSSAPDGDVLWSYYRSIQEKRWYAYGQEVFTSANIPDALPGAVDAAGKAITIEDIMRYNESALGSWEQRAKGALTKRTGEYVDKDAKKITLYRGELVAGAEGRQPNMARSSVEDIATGGVSWKPRVQVRLAEAKKRLADLEAQSSKSWKVESEIHQLRVNVASDEGVLAQYADAERLQGVAKEYSDLLWLTEQPEIAQAYATQQEKGIGALAKKPTGYAPTVDKYDIVPEKTLDLSKYKGGALTDDDVYEILNGIGITDADIQGRVLSRTGFNDQPSRPADAFALFRGDNAPIVVDKLRELGYDTVKMAEGRSTNWLVLDRDILTGGAKDQLGKRAMQDVEKNVLDMLETNGLKREKILNQAKQAALDDVYFTYGNFGTRTNLDHIMQGIGMPFWFFPSRSIPFYSKMLAQHPGWMADIYSAQSAASRENPQRLFGYMQVPGTDFYVNPYKQLMGFNLFLNPKFTPSGLNNFELGNSMLQNVGMSFGPQFQIAQALVGRWSADQFGRDPFQTEPRALIPQQNWIKALAGVNIPVVSQVAGAGAEVGFDAYLRAVYGEEVANWQQQEVEKYMVSSGVDPAEVAVNLNSTDPDKRAEAKNVLKGAWKSYYARQLASIPGGVVKRMTPSEKAHLEYINKQMESLPLTDQEKQAYRDAGVSPLYGQRSDYIEAFYKDVPAEKLWRNIRPSGLDKESTKYWNDYVRFKFEREQLFYGTDPKKPTEDSRLGMQIKFDQALKDGTITPSQWKELRKDNYQDYFTKVDALKKTYPLAMQEDKDWESFRNMLGWDTPVRHPDDIALDQYYDLLDSSDYADSLGQIDWDKYNADREAYLNSLSPETRQYVEAKANRYKTGTEMSYKEDQTKIQQYYKVQDKFKAMLPPDVAAKVQEILDAPSSMQTTLAKTYGLALVIRKLNQLKESFLNGNPDVYSAIRYWAM